MARWEPDSRDRLEAAALALFGERGFEQTTVAEIAARAGVTERTFFRHYADKREVLFAGSAGLLELILETIAAAPPEAAPIAAVMTALEAAAAAIQERREYSAQRQAAIARSAELQERELVKLATMSSAVADALRGRGAGDPAAGLAAEAGIAVFRVAFERWIQDPLGQDFPTLVRESLAGLRAVTAAR